MDDKYLEQQYPDKDFKKTIYQFSAGEVRQLTTFVTITQMGKFAEAMANNYVSNEVVKRLGVKTTLDSGVIYDVSAGQVVIYLPKVVCSKCEAKRAEFSYKNQVYCKTCVDLVTAALPAGTEEVKQVAGKTEEVKEVKEEKKKKKK